MQNKDIDIFLEVVSSRNITKAAENLYLSQSVVSTRIKKLEEELGYELFVRSKGTREVELTRQGQSFVNLAMRWRNLFEEAELIKTHSQHMLRLACPESVYYDFLEPLVSLIMQQHPQVKMSVQILDSSGVYDVISSNLVDFGFASYESSWSNVLHRDIYDQEFCIVSYTDIRKRNGRISPGNLDPSKEVQLSGGNFSSISLWRDKWYASRGESRIEINSPHMMVNLLRQPGSWALMPIISARHLARLYEMKIYELTEPPESRKIYLLQNDMSSSRSTDAAQIFSDELALYLQTFNPSTGVTV